MAKFGGWLAGILAGIIVGYAVWYLTTPSTTTFEGMVYSGTSAVAKAMVSLELTGSGVNGGTFHNVTDGNGSYLFEFTGLSKTARATFRIAATGFRESPPESLSNPLQSANRHDFSLTPFTTSTPHPGPTPTPPELSHKPRYVRKTAEQATQVRLH